MWSVFNRKTRIYLSRFGALVSSDNGLGFEIPNPEGWALEQTLYELAKLPCVRNRSIDVRLSASHCPAVEITYPAEVVKFPERLAFARSVCARHLGSAPGDIDCDVARGDPGLSSPIMKSTLRTLWEWAVALDSKIGSVRPLWSIASETPVARFPSTYGILLVEPDCVTAVGQAGGNLPTRGLTISVASDGTYADAHKLRLLGAIGWQRGSAVAELTVNFSGNVDSPVEPRYWPLLAAKP